MATDKTTNRYEDLLKSAHKGIDLDQPVHKTGQEEKVAEPVDTIPVDVVADGSDPAKMEPDAKPDCMAYFLRILTLVLTEVCMPN